MRVVDIAQVFQIGHDIPDARRTETKDILMTLGYETGADRSGSFNEIVHHIVQDGALSLVEFHDHLYRQIPVFSSGFIGKDTLSAQFNQQT